MGTELLLGEIVDTNAGEIGAMLAEAGIDCLAHSTVGDNDERIAEAITSGLARADAVIVTGGLGPTQDDVTREAICRALDRRMTRDPEIVDWLSARFAALGRPMPEMNLRQADRPEGSTIIVPLGTAPGLVVPVGEKVVYAVPGVPFEMREMMRRSVVPDIKRRSGEQAVIIARTLRVVGPTESQLATSLSPLWHQLEGSGVTMAFLAGRGEIRVRLVARAPEESAAEARLAPVVQAVRDLLGPTLVGVDADTLEVVVGRLLGERSWTVGVAESLTGGLVGFRITAVPGASEYFRGSAVAYATTAKVLLLGVDDAVLSEHGPVSAPVARAMAAGARERFGADVGLALTGVAGPTEQGAPVGHVILAVDGPLGAADRSLSLPGDREGVREMAATAGLNLLRLYLLEALQ